MHTDQDHPESTASKTRITVTVSESGMTSDLLDCLLNQGDCIDSSQIHVSATDPREVQTVTIDGLTAKQRQAVLRATELGYYDDPRSASLGDFAGALGVSDSAASKRLKSVERRLVLALADQLR